MSRLARGWNGGGRACTVQSIAVCILDIFGYLDTACAVCATCIYIYIYIYMCVVGSFSFSYKYLVKTVY